MQSHKPSKQRKAASVKQLTARVSEEIRKEFGIKRLRVRKDDTVIVMRGKDRGFEGKVVQVFPEEGRIAIEGLTRKKADETPLFVKIHASKVMITKLNTADPRRKEAIERKGKKAEKTQGGA